MDLGLDSGLTDLYDTALHVICWSEFYWYFMASVIHLATICPVESSELALLIVLWHFATLYSVVCILWDYSYGTMIVPEQVFVAEYDSYDYEMKTNEMH